MGHVCVNRCFRCVSNYHIKSGMFEVEVNSGISVSVKATGNVCVWRTSVYFTHVYVSDEACFSFQKLHNLNTEWFYYDARAKIK